MHTWRDYEIREVVTRAIHPRRVSRRVRTVMRMRGGRGAQLNFRAREIGYLASPRLPTRIFEWTRRPSISNNRNVQRSLI